MPEGQGAQVFRDGFPNFRIVNQALAREQEILQKSFRDPVAALFGVVIDSGVEFGLCRLEKNCSKASPRRSASSTQAAITSSPSSSHAHALFDRIKVERKAEVDVARAFGDYTVSVDEAGMPAGVTLIKRV